MKVPRKSTVIDSIFYRPPDVLDFERNDASAESVPALQLIDATIVDGGGDGGGVGGGEIPDTLVSVSFMNIISQTMKTNPDGTHSVDALVEVDDIQGVTSYEVRVTRV